MKEPMDTISPVLDIITPSGLSGVFNTITEMLQGTKLFRKKQWKDIMWSCAWEIKNQDWGYKTGLYRTTKTLNAIMDSVSLLAIRRYITLSYCIAAKP